MTGSLVTRDHPADGVVVLQPKGSFRYSMDPILLAGWALEGGVAHTFLDVGSGSGIISLLLANMGLKGGGVDVVPEWVRLAKQSANESQLDCHFRLMDVRHMAAEWVDLVLCNPPYFPLGTGNVSPDPLRAAARHELKGGLAELIAACARMGPRVCLSVPSSRADEATDVLATTGRPLARRLILQEGLTLLEGCEGGVVPQTESGSLRAEGGHGPLAARLFMNVEAHLRVANRAIA